MDRPRKNRRRNLVTAWARLEDFLQNAAAPMFVDGGGEKQKIAGTVLATIQKVIVDLGREFAIDTGSVRRRERLHASEIREARNEIARQAQLAEVDRRHEGRDERAEGRGQQRLGEGPGRASLRTVGARDEEE